MEVKPKQYLIMVDELSMAMLGKLCPGIVYLEVTGMPITDNPNYQVLVNPLHPPLDHYADVSNMVEDEPKEGSFEETPEVTPETTEQLPEESAQEA
jgi:hypothetical protein